MTFPAFISFGEALTDLVTLGGDRFGAIPGGAGFNVARAVSKLGLASAWAGCLSRDSFGDALQQAADVAGLDPRFIRRVPAPPLLAVVDRLDPPRYFFIGNGSADLAFDPALLPAGWQSHLAWAQFGGISLVREPLGARLEGLARELKGQGVRIAFDPNHRALMQDSDVPRLQRFCRLADAIKISDEDLLGYFPQQEPEDSLAALRALNPAATWLYTRGAAGATLFSPGQVPLHQAALPVAVVDTVGAGDASLAALIAALHELAPADPARQLHLAVSNGALACTAAGAAAPTRAALLAAL
jgi:fructokinase